MPWSSHAKIAFIGSHSVRKSNAVHAFASTIGRAGRSVEVGREVVRFNPLGLNEGATAEAQLWVLMAQVQQELELARRAEVLVTDRSVVDNFAYYLRVTGGEDPFGVVGGYIAASADLCDFVRSFASGFIFTTSLPPAVTAGALASIRHLKASTAERLRHQDRVAVVRRRLEAAGIPMLDNPSHIVPVMVRDPVLCKQISDRLLDHYGIYVQPINYPTVARRTERLRITPSPLHTDADIDHLVNALTEIWAEIGLKRAA